MKQIILIFSMLSSVFAIGQKVEYGVSSVEYKGSTVPSIQLHLEPKPDNVSDHLASWMEDNYEVDLNDRKFFFWKDDLLSAKGTMIPEVSNTKVDLFVDVDERADKMTTLNLFASLGYNNWITEESHPQEWNKLQSITKEWVRVYLPDYYQDKVDDRRNDVSAVIEMQSDLEEEIQENERAIGELESENKDLKRELKNAENKLETAREKLDDSKEVLENVKEDVQEIDKK